MKAHPRRGDEEQTPRFPNGVDTLQARRTEAQVPHTVLIVRIRRPLLRI
jgi:hypothetical protein